MDYEIILFGLKNLLNVANVFEVLTQGAYIEEYLEPLDQLAVHLRSPKNRDIVRESGLFRQLLRVLDMLLSETALESEYETKIVRLSSEVIRCVANCLADNDTNRRVLVGDGVDTSRLLSVQIPRIMELETSSDVAIILQTRAIIMVKNLCLGSEDYTAACSKYMTCSLFTLLQFRFLGLSNENCLDDMIVVLDLLLEFLKFFYNKISLPQLMSLADLLKRVSVNFEPNIPSEVEDEDENGDEEEIADTEDIFSDTVLLLAESIEIIASQNLELDLSTPQVAERLQGALFSTLEVLNFKDPLQNKLIIMRRIVSSIGHISANPTNTNVEEREACYRIIKNPDCSYSIAAALIVLSNSISCREDVNKILTQISLSEIINVTKDLKDPMQFQGFLDLTKKMLNISNVVDLTNLDLSTLFSVLKLCHDQCKYYQNLSPLVEGTLCKLVAILPGSALRQVYKPDLGPIILERGGISACLLLDKFSLHKENVDHKQFEELWSAIFKFNDSSTMNNGVSPEFLFQLTKSLGVYLRPLKVGEYNIVLDKHSSELSMLLETALSLKAKPDSASRSIWNNGSFVAGMIVNLLKQQQLSPEELKLQDIALRFFQED